MVHAPRGSDRIIGLRDLRADRVLRLSFETTRKRLEVGCYIRFGGLDNQHLFNGDFSHGHQSNVRLLFGVA